MKKLCVLYMAGAGDAKAAFQAWANHSELEAITHVGYSHQFFDACAEVGASVLALTTHANDSDAQHGEMRVERIDDYLAGTHGLAYHAAQVILAAAVIKRAVAFRANVVVIGGEPHPELLAPLQLLGVRVVLAHHCVLWPAFQPRSTKSRVLFHTQRPFYRFHGDAVLSASSMVSAQVQDIAGERTIPIVEFFPLFRSDLFSDIPDPEASRRPFRVMFVGRVEANKGVFDLMEIARRLRAAQRSDIVIDICGSGAASAALEGQVREHGLQDLVVLHGWCDAQKLRSLQMQSHAAIVPTRTDFVEGFNHVIVEALLARRPVVTSKVCPAVHYLSGGVTLAHPDDPESYFQQLVKLVDDPAHYRTLQAGARDAGREFLSDENSYRQGVRHVLTAFAANQKPAPHIIAPVARLGPD